MVFGGKPSDFRTDFALQDVNGRRSDDDEIMENAT